MNGLSRFVFLSAVQSVAVFATAVSLRAGLSLHTVDTMTITDMKSAANLVPVPTAARPIYYEAVDVGMNWPGGAYYAGDKLPNVQATQDAVVRALGRNHYLSADAAHPATELIVMAWGTLLYSSGRIGGVASSADYYRMVRILAGDKYMDGGDPSEEGVFASMGSFIPHRVIPALSQHKLHDYALGDCYYVEVRGYSAADAHRDHATELWQTRIACPSAGLVMDTSLLTMIRLAAPHIGVETKGTVFDRPEKNLRENIEYGDLRVLDEVDVKHARVIPLQELMRRRVKSSD